MRATGSGDLDERFVQGELSTVFLPAGEYLFTASCGGGVSLTDSPHAESDAMDTSVDLRFLAP